MMTAFRRWPDGAIRSHRTSELIHAPSDPRQNPRHLGTVEPLWTLFDFTPGWASHRRRADRASVHLWRWPRQPPSSWVGAPLIWLRKPPVTVAPGTIGAESTPIRVLSERESGQPRAQGCAPPARQAVRPPGRAQGERTGPDKRAARHCDPHVFARKQSDRPRNAARRGMGSPPAMRLSRHADPFLLRRSPGAPARAVSSRDESPVIRGSRMPSTTGHASHVATVVATARTMRLCDNTVAATHVPSARSAIGYSMSTARCFAAAPNLTSHWKAKNAR
jgi:hypothetical protein